MKSGGTVAEPPGSILVKEQGRKDQRQDKYQSIQKGIHHFTPELLHTFISDNAKA